MAHWTCVALPAGVRLTWDGQATVSLDPRTVLCHPHRHIGAAGEALSCSLVCLSLTRLSSSASHHPCTPHLRAPLPHFPVTLPSPPRSLLLMCRRPSLHLQKPSSCFTPQSGVPDSPESTDFSLGSPPPSCQFALLLHLFPPAFLQGPSSVLPAMHTPRSCRQDHVSFTAAPTAEHTLRG